MATIYNQITINAPVEKIWAALTNIEELDKYDPTVKKSTAITAAKSGLNAKRKVDMLNGKNWFEEKVSEYKPNEVLAYELTACSFPINNLKHTYSFEKNENAITVKQVMQYQVKFGFIGKMLDALMIRKQSDAGIKKFFAGLKEYVERG